MANEKNLPDIEGTDSIAGSWRRLLTRDRNVSNFFSGTDFTTDQTADDIGRPNWRTDLNRLYIFNGTTFKKLWDFLTPEEIAYAVDHPDVPADVDNVKAILDLIVQRNNLNTVTMPATSQTFSGSGTENTFELERFTSNKNTLYIFINGIKQANDTFELSEDGMSIIFNQAPALGTSIEVMQLASLLEYDYSPVVVDFTGDGATDEFTFDIDILNPVSLSINIDGKILQHDEYSILSDGKTVHLNTTPVSGAKIQMMTVNKTSYITVSPNSIGTLELKQGGVTSSKIADKAVTAEKIADKAVMHGHIADGAVWENNISNLAVTEAKLATNAVTTDKIKDADVTEAKLDTSLASKINGKEDTSNKQNNLSNPDSTHYPTTKAVVDEINAIKTEVADTYQKKSEKVTTLANATDDTYPSTKAVKDAIDDKDSLPSQTGNAGKYLSTNGINPFWDDGAGSIVITYYD